MGLITLSEKNLQLEKKKNEIDKTKKDKIIFIRHANAGYKTHKKGLVENPEESTNYNKQITPDLPQTGIGLAEKEAEKFFNDLNPEEDSLFFVSSEEARALETASIYKQIAKAKGFEIIKSEHTRSKTADEIGGGEIRKLDTLSLGIDNNLVHSIFTPKKYLVDINFDEVDDRSRDKYEEARQIVDSDDKGSWGSNFYHHSEKVKKIFPGIKAAESAKDLYEGKFKNMLRLAKFAHKKMDKNEHSKNVKVLAFGHENYISYALNKYFGDHEIDYCEAINFNVNEDKVTAKLKNVEKEIE